MKYAYTCLFKSLILLFLPLIISASGGNGTATLSIDFNGCNALNDGNERDYSEFIAQSSNLPDLTLSLVNNNLYRERSEIHPHSCVEGLDGSPAMCVSFAPFCNYNPGSPEAVRFDLRVTPGPDTEVKFTSLRFQEQAPFRFKWLGNDVERLNNYPQYFSIRILREDRVIYEETYNTSRSWNDRLIVLDDAMNEIITEETILNVELIAYCPVGYISPYSIWDLDNIQVDVECLTGPPPSTVDAGTISGGPFEICGGLDTPSLIPVNGINLTGNIGTNQEWIITGVAGNIVGITNDIYSYNLNSLGNGTYLIYHLAYDGTISNLAIGNNILDLAGNYDISDPLGLTTTIVKGGTISGGPFSFCVGDGAADVIAETDIIITDAEGSFRTWIVLDASGLILATAEKLTNINFDGFAPGTCNLCVISHEGPLTFPTSSVLDITGCYDISSELHVVKENCNNGTVSAGTLTGGPFDICGNLDSPSLIPANGITLVGNQGMTQQWIITGVTGNIIGITDDIYTYNLNSLGNGSYFIYHLAYDGMISNLAVGNNILDLAGNYDLSAPLGLTTTLVKGGILTGGPYNFCTGDGVADVISETDLSIVGAEGSSRTWIVIDDAGLILATAENLSTINFDDFAPGTCDLCVISHEGALMYPTNNISDITGCFDISTEVIVIKESCGNTVVNGGTLTGGPFTFCANDGDSDLINNDDIILTGSNGTDQWVITNDQGIIVGLPNQLRDFNFDNVGAGDHNVWNLSYIGTITGLTVGENVSNVTGDFALSNAITINTNTTNGGTIAIDRIDFCVNDGIADMIPFNVLDLTGNIGENSQWVITDQAGVRILSLPDSPYNIDFDNDTTGTVALWHVSYTGNIEGLEVGSRFNDIDGCFHRSNFVSISKHLVEESTLAGGPFEVCLDFPAPGTLPNGAILSTGGVGSSMFWLVTDADDRIIFVSRAFTDYDFKKATPGSYKVYQIHYEGVVENIQYDTFLEELEGCLKLSNALEVNVRFCINDRVTSSIYTVYPNPSMEYITISTDDAALEDSKEIIIVDRYGRHIPMASKKYDTNRMDIRHLQEGTYFIKILKEDGVISLPFIKSN